jgi:hypothetical protein
MKRKFSHRRQQHGNVRDLLTRGIAAAKAGNREEARFYLEWVLITEATEEQRLQAWLWLSSWPLTLLTWRPGPPNHMR